MTEYLRARDFKSSLSGYILQRGSLGGIGPDKILLLKTPGQTVCQRDKESVFSD